MALTIQSLLDVISRWRGRTDEAPEQLDNLFPRGRPSKQTPPNAPGIYRIRHRTGPIAYIGISVDLLRRKGEHRRYYPEEEYDFEWKAIDRSRMDKKDFELLRAKEREQIDRHNPPDNGNRGGGGRIPRL